MAYTEEHTKESLSRAYVSIVAGMAGIIISKPDHDYGVDGTFAPVKGTVDDGDSKERFLKGACKIDYQLKATTVWSYDNEKKEVIYDLEAKTYNDIVNRSSDDQPLILILMCLPKDKEKWLDISSEELILRNCCFWWLSSGNKTKNRGKVRIRIPESNILNVDAIKNLLDKERVRRMEFFS
ncbi:DUF4365 domain-containing protein [Thalassospira sp. MCCC 1A03138]|uniref:DUF4365 domain-containing protein n=1 Tax=Thalassospira sp. MCCC 1A03138 TaxID=1470576 RepID=UPI000A1E5947|nr:DUF4365 domain-containing protein [Thalassospira sp. MCCC 1A03138]OSQ32259.1 hypothetical protein TH468_01095 [Thalassospira sp. MCCC 1A03138]